MEWPKIAESLVASGPLAMALGAACVLLWRKLEATQVDLAKSKDERIADLKSMLKSDD